jgi:threonine/homoserine/homoserine lactone efflux protein
MTVETWLLFCATEVVVALTPGPCVLFVLSQGVRGGAERAVAATTGVLSANAVYFTLSALGLSAVLLASYEAFTVVKWLGAAYLVFLGVTTIARARDSLFGEATATPVRFRRTMINGAAMQFANPKGLLYFTAIVPQFVHPGSPVAAQIAILGITSMVVEAAVLAGYGAAAGRARTLLRRPRFSLLANRAAGGLLVAAGAGLAATPDR